MKTLTFRPIQPKDVTLELLKQISLMHVDYFKHSLDDSLRVPQVLDVINAVVTREVAFNFWLLLDEDKLAGFALTELNPSPKGWELHIAQAYIAPGYREKSTQELTIQGFEKYAKEKGCRFLTSCTRREPQKAYERWMGRVGFKKRYVMMEKDLREG